MPVMDTVVRAVALVCAVAGCAHLGVVSDGTSVSVGRTNRGGIVHPARLPDTGDGYWTPTTWRVRGVRYGVDELIDLIAAVGRKVGIQYPKSRLAVGDLSPPGGGAAQHHRSHQSGRDVDLLLFYTRLDGTPVPTDTMHVFGGPHGAATDAAVALDVPRTWAVIRALVTSTEAEVQRIFLYEPLALILLDHARAIGEPELIVDRARSVLRQPSDSAPHNDHMHVRIFCPAGDLGYGCINAVDSTVGQDKPPPRLAALTPAQRRTLLSPMPAMLALVGWSALR
jgi:penicillin-insensitive murein endopeptidase